MLDPDKFTEMFGKIERIDERTIATASKVEQLATKEEVGSIGKRVGDLEDERKWIKRASLSAVFTAGLAIVKAHWGWG
jgi:hypothetical protein